MEMPRLSKKMKQEWDFFIQPSNGRRTYNDLCRRCFGSCKQSFRAEVIACPGYISKRTKGSKPRSSHSQIDAAGVGDK